MAASNRAGRLNDAEYAAAKDSFENSWDRIEVIQPNDTVMRAAGDLSELLELRGDDSVQLASAMYARSAAKGVYMLTWDNNLARASFESGISVIRTTDA